MYFFKAVFNKIIKFMTFLTHVFKETKKKYVFRNKIPNKYAYRQRYVFCH